MSRVKSTLTASGYPQEDPPVTLSCISLEEAKKAVLSQSLGNWDQESQDDSWRAEALRACLWALSGQGQDPVRTVRITNMALSLSLSDAPEDERDCLRGMLDALEAVGDATYLGGLWLPAPTRIVTAPEGKVGLLVGGLPTSLVPLELRGQLTACGAARRFPLGSDLERWLGELGTSREDLQAWCGMPEAPLERWGEGVMATPLTPFNPDGAQVQAYLPGAPKTGGSPRAQGFRWGSLPGIPGATRLLVRQERVGAFRDDFYVAEVAGGNVVCSGPLLPGDDRRRLMYFLDAQAGESSRVSLQREEGGGMCLTLSSELPPPELRLLAAYGTLLPNETGKYYPRRWLLSNDSLVVIRGALEALRIQVKAK